MKVDWSEVKGAIGTIAPWIAGTLGSPVAGVAVKALCGALGMNADTAKPDDVVAALAGATPEQLLALKQADLKHQEVMTQLGYDRLNKIDQIDADDRNSARQREMAVKDSTPKHLAYTLIGGFLSLSLAQIVAIMWWPDMVAKVPSQGWLLVGNISGYLAAEAKSVAAYYFGSSVGSERKTELLAQAPSVTSEPK